MVNTSCWPKWPRGAKLTFLSNFDVNASKHKFKLKMSMNINDMFWMFQTFEHMKMCQTYDVCLIFNLGNKNSGIYCHLSLILCYFWRQNCSKTSILLFWVTLVNTCWPYVCDITKWSLGACKYLSQVPSPQISARNPKLIARGQENHFFNPTRGWWNNHLHFNCWSLRIFKIEKFQIIIWKFPFKNFHFIRV